MLVEVWKDGIMTPEAQDWPALPEKGAVVNFFGSDYIVEDIKWHFGEHGKFVNVSVYFDSIIRST